MAYDTILDLFKGICDALRNKNGTTAKIKHQDIPAKIKELIMTGNGQFLWKMYPLVNKWDFTTGASLGQARPGDCSTTVYAGYEITNDGFFSLKSGTAYLGGYCAKNGATQGTKQIYQYKWNFVLNGDSYYTYHLMTLNDEPTERDVKGEKLLGYMSSDDETAYPEDGIKDGYWYKKVI